MSQAPAPTGSTGDLVQTTFWRDPDTALPADEPSAPTARLFWLTLTLLQFGKVDLTGYHRIFTRGEKTLQRDLAKLRKLGERYGFRFSRLRRGEVCLTAAKPKLAGVSLASSDLGAALRAVALALGDPVAADLPAFSEGALDDGFLRIAVPRPIQDTVVGKVYRALRAAAAATARVSFRYRRRDRAEAQRTVDPYAAIFHSGRYYLVAYDVRAHDWRLFALDGILGEVKRVGTFTRRALPRSYAESGAIGLIKNGPRIEVSIELSPVVAIAAGARSWHRDQQLTPRPDGSAVISLPVYDAGEAVRWAMSFGADATIVSPPSVVAIARETAAQLAEAYSTKRAASRSA